MKLFTIGLIAGTAFAEPNLRPADRKLDETTTVIWPDGSSFDVDSHTLTITGEDHPFPALNTADGVKVLALAYYKQEYGKMEQCMIKRDQFDVDVTDWGLYQEHLTTVTDWGLYQEHLTAVTDWGLYQANLTAVANYKCRQNYARLRAAKEATETRRRLEITSQHLLKALEYGNMLTNTMIDTECGEETSNPGDWAGDIPSDPTGEWTAVIPSGPPGEWTAVIPSGPPGENSDDYTWYYGDDTTGNSIDACDPSGNTDTCTLTHLHILCRLQVIYNVIKALDPAMTDESIADTVD